MIIAMRNYTNTQDTNNLSTYLLSNNIMAWTTFTIKS